MAKNSNNTTWMILLLATLVVGLVGGFLIFSGEDNSEVVSDLSGKLSAKDVQIADLTTSIALLQNSQTTPVEPEPPVLPVEVPEVEETDGLWQDRALEQIFDECILKVEVKRVDK